MSDLVDRLMAFEDGELEEPEALELFSELIKSGTIMHLQGAYVRAAAAMIDRGLLSPEGDVL